MLVNPPLARSYNSAREVQARVDLVLRAWTLLILLSAAGQVTIGIFLLLSGADGFRGPIFARATFIPWWGWGVSSVIAGLLLPWAGVLRDIGSTIAVVWYGLWWALLGAAIIMPPDGVTSFPLYPLAVYGFLAAVHVLTWAVEFISANPWASKDQGRA